MINVCNSVIRQQLHWKTRLINSGFLPMPSISGWLTIVKNCWKLSKYSTLTTLEKWLTISLKLVSMSFLFILGFCPVHKDSRWNFVNRLSQTTKYNITMHNYGYLYITITAVFLKCHLRAKDKPYMKYGFFVQHEKIFADCFNCHCDD